MLIVRSAHRGAGVARLRRRRCRLHRLRAVQDAQPHGARRRRSRARSGCSSAKRRVPRKTRRASLSSDRPGGCSTTCSLRWACDATSNVYIANVLKCRPPGNRAPTPLEIESCRPYLDRQIELIRPKLIIALGKSAATTLLNVDATHRQHARTRSSLSRACRLIVTYHPAYLLRNLPDKAKAWEDLCLARATMRVCKSDGDLQIAQRRTPTEDGGEFARSRTSREFHDAQALRFDDGCNRGDRRHCYRCPAAATTTCSARTSRSSPPGPKCSTSISAAPISFPTSSTP